jgi:hypothetical protein
MELQEAIGIVRKLADGLHPETGRSLPEDSLSASSGVRALQNAVDALEIQDQKRRTRNSLPPKCGQAVDRRRRRAALGRIAARNQPAGDRGFSQRRVGSIVARIMRLRQKAFADQKRRTA